MEPPYITLVSPYGGFGLKTKTSEAARRRIDGLLAGCAVEVVLEDLELRIAEPASRAMIEAMVGPLGPDTSAMSTSGLSIPPDTHAHVRGAIADEAWRAFGAPGTAGVVQRRTDTWIAWEWRARRDEADAAYDPWCRFLDRHQALAIDDRSSALQVRGDWAFRLASADGTIAEPPLPASRAIAHLRGRHASAFLPLVFAHAALTDGLIADFERVCDALGMKLPARALRLSSPTRGSDRKLAKLS
jgi:hypothetical protein